MNMIFLKALSFLVFNLLLGFLFVNLIRALLFSPKKKWYISGKHVPYTPGFLHRKHDQLISIIRGGYRDYLESCKSDSRDSMISKWENKAFRTAWNKLEMIEGIFFLPGVIKEKIRYFFAMIYYEIVKQFFRSFIPYLMEKYRVEKYVDLFEEQLDMKIIVGYYNRYIHRYLLIFFSAMCFLIGIINMIWFLIIH